MKKLQILTTRINTTCLPNVYGKMLLLLFMSVSYSLSAQNLGLRENANATIDNHISAEVLVAVEGIPTRNKIPLRVEQQYTTNKKENNQPAISENPEFSKELHYNGFYKELANQIHNQYVDIPEIITSVKQLLKFQLNKK